MMCEPIDLLLAVAELLLGEMSPGRTDAERCPVSRPRSRIADAEKFLICNGASSEPDPVQPASVLIVEVVRAAITVDEVT